MSETITTPLFEIPLHKARAARDVIYRRLFERLKCHIELYGGGNTDELLACMDAIAINPQGFVTNCWRKFIPVEEILYSEFMGEITDFCVACSRVKCLEYYHGSRMQFLSDREINFARESMRTHYAKELLQ